MVSLKFLVISLASTAMGHMIMRTPYPYGDETLNNSPLGDVAEFPCKQRAGVYTVDKNNPMPVGQPQLLSFLGSAVHGGGSCQLSVSLDKEPTASSTFKVIHSIIGGCPGVSGGPSNFTFSIPNGFPNGDFALAWTWVNHIGNREFYMNCAPITVTGGSDGDDGRKMYDSLPDLFIANLPGSSNTCKTPEMVDAIYPNPGDSVQTIGVGPFATVGADCGGSGSGSSGGGASAPQTGSSIAHSSTYNPAGAGGMPTSFTTIYVTSTPSTTAPSAPTAAAGPPYSNNTSSLLDNSGTSGSTASGNSDGSCSNDGALVCNNESQFGICDHGSVVWQQVAPGTKCQNGQITRR